MRKHTPTQRDRLVPRPPSTKKKSKTPRPRKRREALSLPNPNGVLWGARAIGAAIGRNERDTFYLLEHGKVPGRKVGVLWCSTTRQLVDYLSQVDTPQGEGE